MTLDGNGCSPFDPLSAAEHKDSLPFEGQLEGGSGNLGFSVLSLGPVLLVCPWDTRHPLMENLIYSEIHQQRHWLVPFGDLLDTENPPTPPPICSDESTFFLRAMVRGRGTTLLGVRLENL